MTIYAIVNDLIDPSHSGASGSSPVWTTIAGSALLQGGNPYFVPDFAERFEACPAIAVRIGRLGKGIAPRFVDRYVDAVAPAAMMIASDLLEELKKKGLPWAQAISYDRSVAIGEFIRPATYDSQARMLLHDNDTDSTAEYMSRILKDVEVEKIVSSLSRDNTLKTGDILLMCIAEGASLKPGMRIEASIPDGVALGFNVR